MLVPQGMHGLLIKPVPVAYNPATQRVQAVAPGLRMYVPAAQAWHVEEPETDENEPARHVMHEALAEALSAEEYLPDEQAMQSFTLVAPSVVE